MFLSVRKIRNQRYLYLLETVPGKKQGTHTNRIVKNLGNFDKLPEEVRNAYLDKKAKQALAKSFELQLREKTSARQSAQLPKPMRYLLREAISIDSFL